MTFVNENRELSDNYQPCFVNIIGGLGNQMFQYAFALQLSKTRNVYLCVDQFENYKLHNGYELERIFNISAHGYDDDRFRNLLGFWSHHGIRKYFVRAKFSKILPKKIVVESSEFYEPQYLKNKDGVLYAGYWQSYKYFPENIIDAFPFPDLDYKNQKFSERILSSNSVSIHIRRSDYLTKKNQNIYKSIDLDYYINAINYLRELHEGLEFYVFTDDVGYYYEIEQLLGIKSTLVDFNSAADSYRDMQLMTHFNHNIIANSTFSWWGAALNLRNRNSIICPEKWFSNGRSVQDLLPNDWIKL